VSAHAINSGMALHERPLMTAHAASLVVVLALLVLVGKLVL